MSEDLKETFYDIMNLFNRRYIKATLAFAMLNGVIALIPTVLFAQIDILGFMACFVAANLASIIWVLIIQLENKTKDITKEETPRG